MGIWGKIIREWLDEILPENATEMCVIPSVEAP
jgi:hypothetical protein